MYFWLNYSDGNNHIERIPVAVKNIDHLFHTASEVIRSDKAPVFTFRRCSNRWWCILRKTSRRYRINCLHRGTAPKIADLFSNKKIFKPRKHLLSFKHRLFTMTFTFWLADSSKLFTNWVAAFSNNFDVSSSETIITSFKQYFLSNLVRTVFIVFPCDFEKARQFSSLILTLYFVAHWLSW